MCYYCYLYETISLWRFLYWKHVYCPKFSWRLCRLQNSCHLHIRVAIPFYIFKISPSFPAGIRDIAAIMCHWYKGPISSFLVSFFFMAQCFCPIRRWNSLPFHRWLFVLSFFFHTRMDGSYPRFHAGCWRGVSFRANGCTLASWGKQLVEHYEQGCKGLKITWEKLQMPW